MRKKLLLFSLSLLLGLPAVAKDFKYEYEGQKIIYTVIDEEAKTVETMHGDENSAGNKVSGNLVLPANPKDGDVEYTLVKISESAFRNCDELTSVIIPNSVTEIGTGAFYDCSGMISVILGKSVRRVGRLAFYNCISLWKIAYPSTINNNPFSGSSYAYNPDETIIEDGFIYGSNKSPIIFAPINLEGEYVIPEFVTTIGYEAFKGCSGLTSVELPSSVTIIEAYAFSGCSGLTSVEIPSSVTEIDYSAFEDCSGLTSVKIPSSVTEIDYSTFRWCSGLTSVEIPSSVTEIGAKAFEGCSGLTSVEIPSSVTSIGYSAFFGCRGLTSVKIPSSVTEIDYSTFRWCSGLTSIEIPSSVTVIEANAFSGCSGLTSIEIPSSVMSIGEYAFDWCSGLISVEIPSSITEIGEKVFDECTNLIEINYITDDPIEAEKYIFPDDVYSNATLYVKEAALDKIQQCEPWMYFDHVAVKDFSTGVEEVIYDSECGIDPDAPMEIYNLSGQQISASVANLAPGIYIVRQGKLTKKIAIK